MIYITHNPYSRYSVIRTTIKTNKSCDWCGQQRKNKKTLFQYGYQKDDSSRKYYDDKFFCSKNCRDTYYLV